MEFLEVANIPTRILFSDIILVLFLWAVGTILKDDYEGNVIYKLTGVLTLILFALIPIILIVIVWVS